MHVAIADPAAHAVGAFTPKDPIRVFIEAARAATEDEHAALIGFDGRPLAVFDVEAADGEVHHAVVVEVARGDGPAEQVTSVKPGDRLVRCVLEEPARDAAVDLDDTDVESGPHLAAR